MARKKPTKKQTSFSESLGIQFLRDERTSFTLGFILFVLAICLLIAFSSYFTTGEADQSLVLALKEGEVANPNHTFQNLCGSIGAIVSDFLIARCFGLAAFGIPIFIILAGLKLTKAYKSISLIKWFFSIALIMIWCSVAFAKFLSPVFSNAIFNPGGDHGQFCSQALENMVGTPGLIALLVVVALAYITYLSAQTVYYVRNILNPTRLLQKVEFSITNNRSDNGSTLTGETEAQPLAVYDNPAPQTVEFSDDGKVTVVEPAYKEADFGKIRRPRVDADGKKPGQIDMEIDAGVEEERAKGKTLTGNDPLSTPINPKEPYTRYK